VTRAKSSGIDPAFSMTTLGSVLYRFGHGVCAKWRALYAASSAIAKGIGRTRQRRQEALKEEYNVFAEHNQSSSIAPLMPHVTFGYRPRLARTRGWRDPSKSAREWICFPYWLTFRGLERVRRDLRAFCGFSGQPQLPRNRASGDTFCLHTRVRNR